jgi:hypothetical protein
MMMMMMMMMMIKVREKIDSFSYIHLTVNQ